MKRVLVAPLDWGLGHTTRCIPIINELLTQGFTVFFAGNKQQNHFIRQHHLPVTHLELFGYDVSYSAIFPQWIKVGFQSLRLRKIIEKEHHWLDDAIRKHAIDIVISDNRYGLHSKKTWCVFITHQLNIPSPILKKSINTINSSFITAFNECWIPDTDDLALSGELSQAQKTSLSIKKIGMLSRLKKINSSAQYDILFMLSGLEPQRSMLEQKLVACFEKTNYRIALIRGIEEKLSNLPENMKQFGLVNSSELEELLAQSETVICRSGYSSIMDLVAAHKKMFLVPTPGQPEQEYLASWLHKKFHIPFIEQQQIRERSIDPESAKSISYAPGKKSEHFLRQAISQLPK